MDTYATIYPRPVRLDQIPATPRHETVQRTYGPGQIVAVVGPPNCGKTALAIHHALCVASGLPWFGRKVARGPVLYVAAEAPGSVTARAQAASRVFLFGTAEPPLYIMDGAPWLGDDRRGEEAAANLRGWLKLVEVSEDEPVKLVILDTLASCLGSGDENGAGMMRLVEAVKRFAADERVTVMLLHHPSKIDPRGMRGHGSLHAACDVVIGVAIKGDSRVATIVKARDGATGESFPFRLEVVELPDTDLFGDTETTVIVRPIEASPEPQPAAKRVGKHQAQARAALRQFACDHPEAMHLTREALSEILKGAQIDAKRRRDVMASLIRDGVLSPTESGFEFARTAI